MKGKQRRHSIFAPKNSRNYSNSYFHLDPSKLLLAPGENVETPLFS